MARKPPPKHPETPVAPSDWLSNKDIEPTDPELFWKDGKDGLELVNTFPTQPETGVPMEDDSTTPRMPVEGDPDLPAYDGNSNAEEPPGKPRRRDTPCPAPERVIFGSHFTPYVPPTKNESLHGQNGVRMSTFNDHNPGLSRQVDFMEH